MKSLDELKFELDSASERMMSAVSTASLQAAIREHERLKQEIKHLKSSRKEA